jgi:hypothetical protein
MDTIEHILRNVIPDTLIFHIVYHHQTLLGNEIKED